MTSEVDSSYPQSSKDLINNMRDPPQTTLYELLEYAKTRSILKNSNSHSGGSNNSNHESFVIRSLNSVQFNQNQSSNENSSIKSKKIPIRISSLKRETKTAQTLRYVLLFFSFAGFFLGFHDKFSSKVPSLAVFFVSHVEKLTEKVATLIPLSLTVASILNFIKPFLRLCSHFSC